MVLRMGARVSRARWGACSNSQGVTVSSRGSGCSLLYLQGVLLRELVERDWQVGPTVLVMVRDDGPVESRLRGLWIVDEDHANAEWLAAWGVCEPERDDVAAHADTVFELLRGHARFVRHEDRAVGISIESDGFAFLCCIAVAPGLRGSGLGIGVRRRADRFLRRGSGLPADV